MTQEEKAKAYDEAKARISRAFNSNRCTIGFMNEIFPELKELGDEKTRKRIIALVNAHGQGMYKDDMLAWLENIPYTIDHEKREGFHLGYKAGLEKQGEQKPIINVPPREVILAIWDLGNEWKELTNGSISTEYGTQLDYIQKHWHESEYYLREKQGGQKHDDKVKPKFKVGDYVVGKYISGYISEVRDDCYLLDYQGFSIDKQDNYHLWTIADAKEGDVLINWNNTTFIFKGIEDETVKFHIAYNEKLDAIKTPLTKLHHLGLSEPQFEFRPATKEQRILLFAKMKEAGYEWDTEKKELRKIEHKPAWSCEDETRLQACIDCLQAESLMGKVDTVMTNWLKSLKDRVLPQPKQEWSKEDQNALEDVREAVVHYWGGDTQDILLYWLKSLKQRIAP